MALSIATNTSAATAHRYLKTNDMEASRSLAKLSSGSRIVRASDDAASLAVGTKLKADVNALRQAQVNASHGASVLQVADGALQQVSDILTRMKALATQAVSGSISDTERSYLDSEFTQLEAQLDDIATQTKFNSDPLLDGTYTSDFAVGTDATNDVITVAIGLDVTAATLVTANSVDTLANAQAAALDIDTAIDSLLSTRSTLGAQMSRFDFVSANLATSVENVDAARSTLMDVDVAAEMANYSSRQVVMQASVAMLAQANQMPQA
ncbi:MAG: flagellin, partial [Geminicoccaceae bacterium]